MQDEKYRKTKRGCRTAHCAAAPGSAQVLAVGGCGVCPHRVGHVVAEADVVRRSGGQDGLVAAADDLLYRKQFHGGPPCPCDAGQCGWVT